MFYAKHNYLSCVGCHNSFAIDRHGHVWNSNFCIKRTFRFGSFTGMEQKHL